MMWYIIGAVVLVLIIIVFFQKKQSKKLHVNPLDVYLNQEVEVTEPISDTLGTGKVSVDGMEIQARRGKPGVIDSGKKVVIKKVQNNAFLVDEKG